MYIVDRNQSERADHSNFEEEVLSEDSTRKTLQWLLPVAVVMVLLAVWALFTGASPFAFVVAGILFFAIASSATSKK